MIKLRLPGATTNDPNIADDLGEFASELGTPTVVHATTIDQTRDTPESGTTIDAQTSTDADADDIVELRWEGDIVELVAVSDVKNRFGTAALRGDGELSIPTSLDLTDDTTRARRRVVLKALRLLRINPAERLTEEATRRLIGKLETKRMPNPGLYPVRGNNGSLGARVDQLPPSANPRLILVHGTFSNTQSSFGELFNTAEWTRLQSIYGDQIFALEHHTLTTNPAANACALLAALPPQSTIDLLTHSRGGLVGELLCRQRWSPTDDHLGLCFGDVHYDTVRSDLVHLAGQLATVDPSIRRFARVACPAAGTLLASERLDRYLNVVLNVVGRLFGFAGPAYQFLKAVALAIVSSRTKPEVLPGLEAMMPRLERGFVPFLNASPPINGQELAVIAGDVEGGGLFSRLKTFFVDLYYREDNDFVVDSRSMFLGVPRSKAQGMYLRSPEATHFSYFDIEATRRCMTDWLVEGASTSLKPLDSTSDYGGLRGIGGPSMPKMPTVPPPVGDTKPVVFLLPGIMGTHLAVDRDRIWIAAAQLAWGGLQKLAFGKTSATDGLVERYYERLYWTLATRYRVEPFPYDWRLSIAESAAKLADYLDKELDAHPTRPVRIVAHSMGGLVARTVIANHPQVWRRLVARSGRLVMLGTPNHGSYVPVQVFVQEHSLMRWLARLDLRNRLDELTRVVKQYPGLVQMLPWKGGKTDLLSADGWAPFPSFRPSTRTLQEARQFRTALAQGLDAEHMVYVAGWAKATPASVEVAGRRIKFLGTSRGDGTVPWDLGLLDGVPTYYVDAEHGQLPNHLSRHDGIFDLLETGRTHKLSRVAPVVLRGEEELFPLPDDSLDEPRYYPGGDELLTALYGKPVSADAERREPLTIYVSNGDVREARHPVVVGHYEGDPLVSVERIIDAEFTDRALSRRHRANAYPGPLGTFLIENKVVVVGLGRVGELRGPDLRATVTRALVEFAFDRKRRAKVGEPIELKISSLLIGTWGGTKLTIEESLECIAHAAVDANRLLERAELHQVMRFTELEFIEVYQDVAVSAAHAASRVAESSDGALHAAAHLRQGRAHLRSRPQTPYAKGWARRIKIHQRKGVLHFTFYTDAARTLSYKRRIEWPLVEGMLANPRGADREARAVLFQYLLPIDLVIDSERGTDMQLLLDVSTANIPWELLSPTQDGLDPLGARVGIVRQLDVPFPRHRVRRSRSYRALVIGNPADSQPSLPAAKQEAEAVTRRLNAHGIAVESCVDASSDTIFRTLLREDYDIIHIAAHGEYNRDTPSRSGVIIGTDKRLTSDVFSNLPGVPAIVFLNCCHLGQLDAPGAFAASVAQTLIAAGVSVVVAAGWAVSDEAAIEFATTFYDAMCEGRTLIDAVAKARRHTFHTHGARDVTWGAYQVYGDVGYILPGTTEPPGEGSSMPVFVAVQEVVDYFSDCATRVRGAGSQPAREQALLQELDKHVSDLNPDWLVSGEVQCAVGLAYGELRAFDKAIDWLQRACTSSDAPFQALEQLANFEARLAGDLHESDPNRARELLKSADTRMSGLAAAQPSLERWAIVGGTRRRMALLETDPDKRSETLNSSLEAYRKACDVEPQARNWFYPAENRACLEFVLNGTFDEELLERVLASAAAAIDFDEFAALVPFNMDLLRYVAGTYDTLAEVQRSHEAARAQRGAGLTPRTRDSFSGQLRLLAKLLTDERARARVEEVLTYLDADSNDGDEQ